MCAEEVDGEVPLERRTVAQVIVERDAGIVDEEIEGFDLVDGSLDLRHVGHVQGQGRDALVGVGQRHASTGIHALRASPQGFLDERPPDAAVGPGNENCSLFDSHHDDDLLSTQA